MAVIAVGTTPTSTIARPEYVPELTQMGGIGGVPVPHNNDGIISWGG